MMSPDWPVRLCPSPPRRNALRRCSHGDSIDPEAESRGGTMPDITVTPLTASIGAEVSGLDLARPLDAATRAALAEALAEHLALVFHDQELTPEQSLAPAAAFR